MKRKVFLSFHHEIDHEYKEELIEISNRNNIFFNESVGPNDIDDEKLTDEQIRKIIRDEYLRDSEVTIVLAGRCSKHRKHMDWEIGSSMIDGTLNSKSGIVVILLPSLEDHTGSIIPSEKMREMVDEIHGFKGPWGEGWKNNFRLKYDFLPQRIIENILKEHPNWDLSPNETIIPIISWDLIKINPQILKEAIEYSIEHKDNISYDTSIPFRKNNNDSCK